MVETSQPAATGPTGLTQTAITQATITQAAITRTVLIDPALTPDERTLALLAHMLQIMLWWIAPLAIFLIKRKSKFISFHALQALLLQVAYVLVLLAEFMLAVAVFFLAAAAAPASRHASPPPEFVFLMPVLGLTWIGMGVLVMLAAIVYGVRAGRGEWAEYPFLGQLALKILKLRSGGVPV